MKSWRKAEEKENSQYDYDQLQCACVKDALTIQKMFPFKPMTYSLCLHRM